MTERYSRPESTPPTARRVACRALVMTALSYRGKVELDTTWREREKEVQRIQGFVRDLGMESEAEPGERDLLGRELGRLTQREAVNMSWLIEGVGVLAWGLGRYTLPPHDEGVEPRDLADSLAFLTPTARDVLARATLVSKDEVSLYREIAFAVHWRMVEWRLRPTACDLMALAGRLPWMDEEAIRRLPLVDGDLSIHGRPIAACSEVDRNRCASIAIERHRAAIWLLGEEKVFSEIVPNT